jgi:mannan endo-1,4-beta-mannosidase
VLYDLKARPTIRRIGGNMFSTYNWRNNAANAGVDWQHANGTFLLDHLDIPKEDWNKPAAVFETFLDHSREVGVPSLICLPLAGFVAADFDGAVSVKETAPSRRFLPVDWSWPDKAPKGAVNIPAVVALLKARHGGAAQGGVRGYYLDNEPGLWPQTHPRLAPKPVSIKNLIARSLRAARAIKAIDPDAWVLGPTSWGATEFTDFVKASDWADYRQHGSFLGAYLEAFRQESERAGLRLLDHMDVHWYPTAKAGDIYRTEKAENAGIILDAPRSLDDPGFCEQSWVADFLGCGRPESITLPILPALKQTIASHFPGTGLAIGEYNYGGAGVYATSLAIADVLGRFGRCGVSVATHWGSLAGAIGEGFRLYRMNDAMGEPFGATSLPVAGAPEGELSVFAARTARGDLHLVVLNKGARPVTLSVALTSGRVAEPLDALGFDRENPACGPVEGLFSASALTLPPLSARRFRLV